MDRRRFLAATTALLPLTAGCIDTGGTDTATPTRTTTRTGTTTSPASLAPGERYTTDEGFTVTVDAVAVHLAVVEFGTVHDNPLYRTDAQFVVADVTVDGDDPPDPVDLPVFLATDTLEEQSRRYVAAASNDDGRQRFGYPVPTSNAPESGDIVWTRPEARDVRWELSAETLSAIARAPAFEVKAFGAETVSGEEVELSLTVENVGERDGRFLAEAGDAGLSDQPEIEVPVPEGETVTATRRVSASFGGREELSVVLRWDGNERSRTVQRS